MGDYDFPDSVVRRFDFGAANQRRVLHRPQCINGEPISVPLCHDRHSVSKKEWRLRDSAVFVGMVDLCQHCFDAEVCDAWDSGEIDTRG